MSWQRVLLVFAVDWAVIGLIALGVVWRGRRKR
jgi:hypothetical protein